MIKKAICKKILSSQGGNEDLAYWLTRTPEERVSTVEFLRRQHHGSTARKKDLADLDALGEE